jgi:hypothetical protein
MSPTACALISHVGGGLLQHKTERKSSRRKNTTVFLLISKSVYFWPSCDLFREGWFVILAENFTRYTNLIYPHFANFYKQVSFN